MSRLHPAAGVLGLLLSPLVACHASGDAAGTGGASLAIVGVHVVPMDRDTVLRDRTVLIDGSRIVAIGPGEEIAVPESAVRIPGEGRYLMPGLTDAHVHLSDSRSELPLYVAYGVTTIFEMGAELDALGSLLRLRDSIDADQILAPTLHLAGPLLDGDPPIVPDRSVVVTTSAEARAAVERLAAQGVDFVKVYNRVPPDALAALGAATGAAGLPLVGHIPREAGAMAAIDAGMDMIAHGEELFFTYFEGPRSTRDIDRSWRPDPGRMPALVERLSAADVWVTPNLSFIATTLRRIRDPEGYRQDPDLGALDPELVADWRFSDPLARDDADAFAWREEVKHELVQDLTLALSRGGVPLLVGTDSALVGVYPGRSAHLELEQMVAAGLTPYEALAAATVSPGLFLKRHVDGSIHVGTVAPGARADLLLVEGNPLEDVGHVRRIAGVVLRGRWIPTDRLAAIRAGD